MWRHERAPARPCDNQCRWTSHIFMRRRYFCLAVLALTSQLLAQAIGSDPPVVDLPTSGTIDERPFFGTRRDAAIDYDRPTLDVVADLIRKVDDGSVKLRYEGSGGYLR